MVRRHIRAREPPTDMAYIDAMMFVSLLHALNVFIF